MILLFIPLSWLLLSLGVGLIGRGFNIGFWGAFLLSFFLSPLLGIIITLITGAKRPVVYYNTPVTRVHVNAQTSWNPTVSIDQLRAEASRRYSLGDYAGCESITQQMLGLNNSNSQVWYMLAVVQSLLKKKEASFNSLAQATSLGYSPITAYESAPQLEWMRQQPEWPTFRHSGYLTVVTLSSQEPSKSGPSSKDRWMEELEMLSQMRFRGDISEEEYQARKSRIRTGLDE